MRRREERLRRGIDKTALPQSMIFSLIKTSFIKRIRGVEVLEVTNLKMREIGTTDRISHLLVRSKIYTRNKLILIELLVKQVLWELLQSNSNNRRTGIMLRVSFLLTDSQCRRMQLTTKTKEIFQMVLEGITIPLLKVLRIRWPITHTMSH